MPAGPRTTPYPVVVQFSDPNNPITPVKLLESSSLFVNSLSAVTISATNYVNLPAIGGATSVFQLDGTGVFVLSSTNNSLSSLVSNIELSTIALSAYIAANESNWAATPSIDLTPYVLTSVNSALSSTVTGHIANDTIHFTSGSLSSAYALSSWVSNNFIDNTEITQYATTGSLLPYALTASLSNYLVTSVNVTSLAGTSTFETTGYARVNYATTGQIQSYVLTSTNLSLSSTVTGHIADGTIHFTSGSLSSAYALSSWVSNNFIDNTEINAYATTGALLNYLLTSVNVTSLAGTGVFALTGAIALSSLRDVTITNPQTYQVLTWNGAAWQPSAVAGVGAATSPGGSTNDIQYNAGGGSFGGANGLTWTAGSQLLSAVNIYSVNASAATISATNYLNLPNFATTATNVTSFQGTGIFETTSYARVNYATTGQLNSYVLTSVNLSLSSTVTGHISDNSIHFTSGSLSSAYALSSWVSDNFIDNTEITAYATTASLQQYETTSYARVNYATTGQLNSYVLTSVNSSLSSTVTGHIEDGSIHFTSGSLSSAYALSSWVSNNFIDNTEITAYATTASLQQYATTGNLASYVLTSTNFILSSLVSNIETSTIALSSYIAANESSWLAGGGITVPSQSSAVVFVGNPGTALSANPGIRINNSTSTLEVFSDAANETGGIDLFPATNLEGLIRWDDDYGTLGIQGDNDTRINLGIDELIPVRNNTGATIYKGQVAYVSGAAAGAFRGTIGLINDTVLDPFTIGVCLKNIANGADGYLIKHGLIKNATISDVVKSGVNLTQGDVLYISDTLGKITNIPPGPGKHTATVGIFLASGSNQISYGVTVKEGYDLQDLHDVGASATQSGDTIAWDSTLGYYVTSSLNSYVLTSTNISLSSTVTGHIADGSIHFTSGSLSSAYALSSWVSNNFIDNTEITAYATTASVQQYETTAYARNNYLLTSVNVTSLAGTSTFETTGYARTNYATTGQIQSYVLTSTNLNLSTLVGSIETSTIGLSSVLGSHISSAVHWTRDQLNTDYINASGDSVNSNFYFNSLSASVISATAYYNVRPLVSSVNSNSVTSFTVNPTYDYYIVSTGDSKVFVDLPDPAGLTNKFIAISKTEQDGSHRSVTVSSQYLKIGGVGTIGQNSVSIFDPTEKVEFISDGTSWNLLGFQKSYGIVTIAKNQTGATIPKGTPVKNCGSLNGVILVSGVSSTNTSLPVSIYDLPDCIGLTEHSIPNNEFGHIISKGTLYDVNTGSFFVGDELYVAEDGGLTRTKPTQPYEIILVGTVTVAHATSGIIEVDIKDLIHLNDIVGFNVDPSLLNNSVASDWTVLRYSNVDKAFINSKINVANVEGTGVFETSAYSRTNFLLTSVNVTSLAGTSTFETTAYARNNYATTGQLGAYVLTSVNFSLSSLVNSHISDGTIHFTSGSLSSAYALSSWVNDTFETTSYARTNYATTGQIQSYVLTSVNLSLSSLVNNHIGSAVHWTRDQLNSDYINASGDSVNSKFYFSGVSATTLSATTYQGVSLSGSLTDVTIASPVNYQVLTWYNGTWQPSSITAGSPGGGTPGGNSTELQYNNGGSFAGTSELVWNSTPKLLSGTNIAALNFSGGTVSATTYLNLPNFATTATNVTSFQGTGIFETTAYARTNYAYLSGAVFTGGVSASQFSATNYYNLPSSTAIWNAVSLSGYDIKYRVDFLSQPNLPAEGTLLFYTDYGLGAFGEAKAWRPYAAATFGEAAIFNANKIQGTSVTATAPTNKQALIYDSTGTSWKPTTLNLSTSLNDVQITSPANDSVLTWSSTASKWVAKTLATVAAKNIYELQDVDPTTVYPAISPVNGSLLNWNDVNIIWEGIDPTTWLGNYQGNIDHNSLSNLPNGNPHTQYATLSGATFTGQVKAPSISATDYINLPSGTAIWNASQLRGVNVTATTPTTHQALVYDGTNWTPSSLPSPVATTPGGPSTSVQFNNNGQFSGVAEFDFIASASRLEVPTLSATTVSAATFAMTYVSAALAADIQMPTSNSFVIGPSATIGPGTWLVNAHATLNKSATTAATYTVRIVLGSTTVAGTSHYHGSVAGIATNVALTCIVSTGASTTVGIRAATSAGATTELLKASTPVSADGNNATIITALKIG